MGRQWAVAIAGCGLCAALVGSAPQGMTLEVSLRSMSDSTPIRGAELVVERLERDSVVPIEDVDDRVITRAQSNERGEIVLRELPAVPVRLKLRAEGYVLPKIDDVVKPQSHHRVDLLLPPAIEITGTVVDESSTTVPVISIAGGKSRSTR